MEYIENWHIPVPVTPYRMVRTVNTRSPPGYHDVVPKIYLREYIVRKIGNKFCVMTHNPEQWARIKYGLPESDLGKRPRTSPASDSSFVVWYWCDTVMRDVSTSKYYRLIINEPLCTIGWRRHGLIFHQKAKLKIANRETMYSVAKIYSHTGRVQVWQ